MLKAEVSAVDPGNHKKYLGSWTTTLIISNKEMVNIMKIVKSLEDSKLLIKSVTKIIDGTRFWQNSFFKQFWNAEILPK